MTNTQIAYWQLQEQKRSNLVNEGLKTQDLLLKEKDINSQITSRNIKSATDIVDTAFGSASKYANLF